MPKKKQEEAMVSIYDPTKDAYREVPESVALKFIESAKKLEKDLKKK